MSFFPNEGEPSTQEEFSTIHWRVERRGQVKQMPNEKDVLSPPYNPKNPVVRVIIIAVTVLGVLLLGGLSYCTVSYLNYQKHLPEYLADNQKVNKYLDTLTKSVQGKDKAAVLEYFHSHGIRCQVYSDDSIVAFPGKSATHTNRWYVEEIHIERNPDGKYWSFSYSYGNGDPSSSF